VRTAALVLGLVVLLALVAAASRAGLPWSERPGGDGVSLERVAQLAALVALAAVTGVLAVAFAAKARRRSRRDPFEEDEEIQAEAEPESRLARFLLRAGPYVLVAVIAVGILFAARGIDRIVPRDAADRTGPAQADEDRTVPAVPGPASGATWVLLGVLGAFGALAAVVVLGPRLGRTLLDARAGRHGTVAALVDESIDDLRSESDPRRAVIAAYARMERGLGRAGLARKPFEAPLEYLRRVLLDLQAGAQPVGRLTELFERAKFSRHDVGEDAKDEAIECLLAIRGDLRTAQ
jgi:uncharacterized protein DUF4129